jgi:UDP-N-acetylglucosamine 4,6-dehydratase
MIKGERIFITGGAGYLGKNLVKRYYDDNEITIFSRDESKHYYLKKKFPKVKCIVGDIRNFDLLSNSVKGHTIGIFAASLKQIEAVDENVEEALQIIIHGAINSRKAAIENGLKSAVFISTDKSRCATTLYGSMKFVGGEAFIINAEKENTLLSSVIYGNVLNSTGSVIPLIWDSIKNNYSLKLYGEGMTRFMIDVEQAMDCIEYALTKTGVNIVPNLKSFSIKDLFEIYKEKFGLNYLIGEPRVSEKMDEQMISPYEINRVSYDPDADMYSMHYKKTTDHLHLGKNGLSSEDTLLSKDELVRTLENHNFFNPENGVTNKKKILVLGHNGMLGNCVYSYLVGSKHYDVLTLKKRWGEAGFIDDIKKVSPDYIINCIGKIPQKNRSSDDNFSNYLDVNIALPIELEKLGIKIIHPSTDCEFEGLGYETGFYNKKDERSSKDPYGQSKSYISKMIEDHFLNTKIIRTSIIGHELNGKKSLLEWFLNNQDQTIPGYTNHLWNGITTLQWAKECTKIIENWNDYPKLTQLGTEICSKYRLLTIINEVYGVNKNIDPFSTGTVVNRCLQSDYALPNIQDQLLELKDFYNFK